MLKHKLMQSFSSDQSQFSRLSQTVRNLLNHFSSNFVKYKLPNVPLFPMYFVCVKRNTDSEVKSSVEIINCLIKLSRCFCTRIHSQHTLCNIWQTHFETGVFYASQIKRDSYQSKHFRNNLIEIVFVNDVRTICVYLLRQE